MAGKTPQKIIISRRKRAVFQRGTWVSILMLGALIGLAYYMNQQNEKKSEEEATPAAETTFIFSEADGLVTSIEIRGAEGEAVKIERNAESVWMVMAPIQAEANQGAAEAAASQVGALPISAEIDKGKDPAIFGLKNPAQIITIGFKDGTMRSLEIGDATPSGNGYYVRVDAKRMLITDLWSLEPLLSLKSSPPYLNTPIPTSVPDTTTGNTPTP